MLSELPSSHSSIAHCPLQFSTLLSRARSKWSKRRQEFHHTGRGRQYIAGAAARSIRDGKTEHELWSLETSLFEMEIFDEVSSSE